MLRRNDPQGDPVSDASDVEGLRRLVEGLGPGRYHVDEIAADPFPPGHMSRRWGSAIKHPAGRVVLDPDLHIAGDSHAVARGNGRFVARGNSPSDGR
jgi:hypothetical protein